MKQHSTWFELWLGSYHLGQGYDPPSKPEMVGKEFSTSFKAACYKYELRSLLESIIRQEGGGYVGEQSLQVFYHPQELRNDWTGKYFETEEEAWQTFPESQRPER